MTLLHKLALMALVAIAALTVTPRHADACSAPGCDPGSFYLPVDRDGNPETPAAVVPANLPAILFAPQDPGYSDSPEPDPTDVELMRIDGFDKTSIPLSISQLGSRRYLLAPDVPLVPDASYRVVDNNRCYADFSGADVTFQTGPALPLPATLGWVEMSEPRRGGVYVPGNDEFCPDQVDGVFSRMTFVPDKSMLPWLTMVDLQTVVNGRIWYREYAWGRNEDTIYIACSPLPATATALREGVHEVSVRARFGNPAGGEPIVIETAPVEVLLECDDDDDNDDFDDEVCTDPDCDDDDAGGCAVGGGGGALAGGLVLLLAALQRSRRRR